MALSSDGTNKNLTRPDSPVMCFVNNFDDTDDEEIISDDGDDDIINRDDDDDEDDVKINQRTDNIYPYDRKMEPSFHTNGFIDNDVIDTLKNKKERSDELSSIDSIRSTGNQLKLSIEPVSTTESTASPTSSLTGDQVKFSQESGSKMIKPVAQPPSNQLEYEPSLRVPLGSNQPKAGKFFSDWTLSEEDLKCLPYKGSAQSSKNKSSSNFSRYGTCQKLIQISPYARIARTAKNKGYDMASFLELAEFTGMNEVLPCMQCFENYGAVNHHIEYGKMDETFDEGKSVMNGRCKRCGGQVQTMASYCVMLRKMKEVILGEDLVPHDVYPDGNCLFAAVVDQLRIKNNFSFSMHSLRLESVEYIRKNPYLEDGTPIEMFLTDESLESYLQRMSLDGVWGDHIILNAIANVISMPIFIYGGLNGDSTTKILPYNGSGENVNTDRRICLGHIGESHYISLRPKKWTENQNIELIQNEMKSEETIYPIQYLNFVLRQLFHMNIMLDPPTMYESEDSGEVTEFECTNLGPVVCNLVPGRTEKDTQDVDISEVFSTDKREDIAKLDSIKFLCLTPKDSVVVSDNDIGEPFDLVAHTQSSSGIIQLVPMIPHLWEGQTITSNEGMVFLKNIDLGDIQKAYSVIADFNEDDDLHNDYCNKRIVFGFKTQWPCVAEAWSTRNRKCDFPNLQTRFNIVDNGCHVISLTDGIYVAEYLDDRQDAQNLEIKWCYSFAIAEREICRLLSSDQRHGYFLFRSLASLLPSNLMLPMAIFKNIFFYCCENVSEKEWSTKPAECFFLLLKKLINGLKDTFIPHYFMPDVNMIEHVPQEVIDENVKVLTLAKRQPVVGLYYLLDCMRHASTEVCNYVEEMLCNICNIDTIDDEQQHHVQAIQASTNLIGIWISQLKFQTAMQVLNSLMQDSDQSPEELIKMVDKQLWDAILDYKWCFYLYVDIRQKTTYTKYLSKDVKVIPITEIFGPDCTEEIPDTFIPEVFSIKNGNIYFLNTAIKTLDNCLSSKVLSGCLKFYLKKYSALAGDALVLPNKILSENAMYPKWASSSMQNNLHFLVADLYTQLFNNYYYRGLPEEFREMLPAYEMINACCDSPTSKRNLYFILTSLGERKKAKAVKSEMGGDMMGTTLLFLKM